MGARAVRIDTLSELVVALCKDYERRAFAIKQNRCSRRVSTEMRFINYKILEAARELVGDEAQIYIREIGSRTGYASSALETVSEVAYKRKKAEVTANIARKLYLSD